jgi:nucleoid-associated protein YejK
LPNVTLIIKSIKQAIEKEQAAAKKLQTALTASKEKVKNLNNELKAVETEKNQAYAKELLEIISAYPSKKEKEDFVKMCVDLSKNAPQELKDELPKTPKANNATDSTREDFTPETVEGENLYPKNV